MIPEASRTALLNDAFNLARAGELSQATALDMTLYLSNETAYVPWSTVSAAMGYLDSMLSTTAIYGAYKVRFQSTPPPPSFCATLFPIPLRVKKETPCNIQGDQS